MIQRISDPLQAGSPKATVGVFTFGDATKTSPKSQFEFNVHAFRDPTGQKQFTGLDGSHPDVVQWVSLDPKVKAVVHTCVMLAEDLLREKPGTTTGPVSQWVSFSFKDAHGKWISPAIGEAVAAELDRRGFVISVTHHGLPLGK